MNLKYISLRLIRHFMPRSLAHFLLRHNLVIKPGYETRAPEETTRRYQETLSAMGWSLRDQRILNFGYGGNFALACSLLEAGARHVTLLDKFAPPDHHYNRQLLPRYEHFLSLQAGQVTPRPAYITLLDADLHEVAADGKTTPFDIVLSSSVYEHLDDIVAITRSLAGLTLAEGCQVHFVDLRDHYFKFPFEMLAYSERAWKNWLNPGSNLNRCRVGDYQRAFEEYFSQVNLIALERDQVAFERARQRIDPKYLTGDLEVDSVTLLQIFAAGPRSSAVRPDTNPKPNLASP